MLKKQIVVLLLLLYNIAGAQSKNELWTKLNITKEVGDKWTLGVDLQYRRQDDGDSKYGLLHYPLGSSVRLAAFYRLPHHWQLLSYPIAYFQSQVFQGTGTTLYTFREFRTSVGALKAFSWGKLTNRNRFLYELGKVQSSSAQGVLRHRYRLQNGLTVPLAKLAATTSIHYTFFNEIFIRTANGTTQFDQNRIFNGLEWKQQHAGIVAGYQWAAQKRAHDFFNKNQVLVTVNIVL